MTYSDIYKRDFFLQSFVATMLEDMQLAENDEACTEEREPRDVGTIYTIPQATFDRIRADCDLFQRIAADDLTAAFDSGTCYGRDSAGADFYLTRVGHGAGYWDRGLGDIGDRLTAHAVDFRAFEPYVGDDEQVHL